MRYGVVVFAEKSKKYGVVGRADDGKVVIADGFTPQNGEIWFCIMEEKPNAKGMGRLCSM